jgi:hypothetical protein
MTRLGMVFMGLIAAATAIAVAVAVATDEPQPPKPAFPAPPHVADLRSSTEAEKVRPPPKQTYDEDDDAGLQALPHDGDAEDGPGS